MKQRLADYVHTVTMNRQVLLQLKHMRGLIIELLHSV